jgi:two-component system chemotaxis sensor kinase CheA
MRALVERIAQGHKDAEASLQQQGEPLLAQLRSLLVGAPAAPSASLPTAPPPAALPVALPAPDDARLQRNQAEGLHADHWQISLRFGPEVLKNGLDPLSFIRYLQTIGQIAAMETLADTLPPLAQMDPECCYLGFEIALLSDASQATIENVFEFVQGECQLRILPPQSRVAASAPDLVPPTVVQAALSPPKQTKDSGAAESRSIRVDADKLDQLINLVGELIIAGANVNLIAHKARNVELQESSSKLSMLVQEVRDSALQLRMVKIGATFSRFQRVVHDVSRELGKDVALVINGEDTELDKTVVEKIGDPLMHLVRNALDHGFESAELRAARGKPAQGTLLLNACHDSGSIVITVQDDGGGLQRERILAKAMERGLLESGHLLSDAEVYGLIFEPGFSTAEKVTNLSGRGVGLDVVKRNITALRGTVGMDSVEGEGTTVTVRLPLTLAIIDGFLVQVGNAVFAIPLDMIEECIAYTAEPGHDFTNLRGQVLPFVRLRALFSIRSAPARSENIVVLKHAGQKAGLVVDKLLGEFQTVIKPLGDMFNHVKCISGSTILGSGEVALILDVPAIVNRCVGDNLSRNPLTPQHAGGLSA